jgi:hypothetical protein
MKINPRSIYRIERTQYNEFMNGYFVYHKRQVSTLAYMVKHKRWHKLMKSKTPNTPIRSIDDLHIKSIKLTFNGEDVRVVRNGYDTE